MSNTTQVEIICYCNALDTKGNDISPFIKRKTILESLLALSISNQEIYLDTIEEDFIDYLDTLDLLGYGEIMFKAEVSDITAPLEGNEFSPRLRGLYGRTNY